LQTSWCFGLGTNRPPGGGAIADSYLNAKARAAVKKILGTESIAIASNWGILLNPTAITNTSMYGIM
jgi:hypothetical protein